MINICGINHIGHAHKNIRKNYNAVHAGQCSKVLVRKICVRECVIICVVVLIELLTELFMHQFFLANKFDECERERVRTSHVEG